METAATEDLRASNCLLYVLRRVAKEIAGDAAGEDMGMLAGGMKKLRKEAGRGEGFIGFGLAKT